MAHSGPPSVLGRESLVAEDQLFQDRIPSFLFALGFW